MESFGWSNFDINMEKIFISTVQSVVPLRIGGMFILNAPWVFKIIFGLVTPFLKKKMKERIKMSTNEQLLDHFEKEDLFECFGGTVPFQNQVIFDNWKEFFDK